MNKYLSFTGTASRSEYWGVTIITFICFVILNIFGSVLMTTGEVLGLFLGGALMLATFVFYIWCFLAVTVKRCREAGINTWWTAACFLPYVGFIPWIVFGCLSPEKKGEYYV